MPLAEGSSEIYVPGDIENAFAARREREGIPLSDEWFERLVALGRELRVDTTDIERPSIHANV